jgi:hypothetical protein
MLGLLHYYDLEKAAGNDEQAENALCAAKRLCDYVIVELGPNGKRKCQLWQTGNWSGLASSSILEPVVWLYNRTKDKRYLDFATYIVKGMTEPASGPRLLDLALEGVRLLDVHAAGFVVVCKVSVLDAILRQDKLLGVVHGESLDENHGKTRVGEHL